MLRPKQLRRTSLQSIDRTKKTDMLVPDRGLVLPDEPFYGADGCTYVANYDPKLNRKGNCYAFSAGWTEKGHKECGDYIPGFLARQPFSIDNMEALVRADMEAVKREVFEVLYDIPEELPHVEGSYWIKAFIGEDKNDFHFAMKEPKSGRWIHKMGWEAAPKVLVCNDGIVTHKDQLMKMLSPKYPNKKILEAMIELTVSPEELNRVTVVGNHVETNDAAGYIAWDEYDQLCPYTPVWVMRISEP